MDEFKFKIQHIYMLNTRLNPSEKVDWTENVCTFDLLGIFIGLVLVYHLWNHEFFWQSLVENKQKLYLCVSNSGQL